MICERSTLVCCESLLRSDLVKMSGTAPMSPSTSPDTTVNPGGSASVPAGTTPVFSMAGPQGFSCAASLRCSYSGQSLGVCGGIPHQNETYQ